MSDGADHATPNLPAADFERTIAFYGALGFTIAWQDSSWLILERGGIRLEFFAARVDPANSWHSASIRTLALDGLYADFSKAGLPAAGIPRLEPPRPIAPDLRMAALVDPDGSLIRILGV